MTSQNHPLWRGVSLLQKEFLETHTYKLIIETAAEQLARHLLIQYPLMEKIDVELKSPGRR